MRVSLDKWRSMTGAVSYLKNVKADGHYKIFRDMLEEEHPRHLVIASPSNTDALIRLGKIEGFDLALNILDIASEIKPPEPKPLESTFQPPEDNPEE